MDIEFQQTLLHLFQQISDDPEGVPAVPVDAWQEGSIERQPLSSFRNVLERLQEGRHDLQKSEERFSLAVQGSNDGLWDWDLRTNIVYFSPRWKSMLGYEEAEIGPHFDEWRRLAHPSDLERALATVQAYLDGQTASYSLEHRMRHKDGSYRWILARGALLRDNDGHPYRMAGSHTDITERIRAEEQLREKEEHYRSIFESTSDSFVISDMNGIIVEANPTASKLYGYSHQELIGRDLITLLHPDFVLPPEVVQNMQGGVLPQTNMLCIRKDGSPIHIEVQGTLFTYKGQPHFITGARNVTEQVQAYQLLEQRVEERTRELSTLLEVSHNVASTIELTPLLELILEQLGALVNYRAAAILLLDGEDLVVLYHRGVWTYPDERLLYRRVTLKDAGLPRKPFIIDDVLDDSAPARAFRAINSSLSEIETGVMRAWMSVPLILKEKLIGFVQVAASEPGYYTAAHATLVQAIANQAAIAIENAQLYEQAQDLAAFEERQRLARELHDSVS